MKQHMQTVINVCLAIGFTLLIYQNIQLKDDVDRLKGFAQLDTDKTWDRLDSIDLQIEKVVSRIDENLVYSIGLAEKIDLNSTNLTNLFEGVDEITTENFKTLSDAIKFNEERIIDNRKAMIELGEIMFD